MKRFALSVLAGVFLCLIPVFLYWVGGGDFVRNTDLFAACLFSAIMLVGGFSVVFTLPFWDWQK